MLPVSLGHGTGIHAIHVVAHCAWCRYSGSVALLASVQGKGQPDDELKAIKKGITTEDVATIIYTSGTTGNPKGVMLTHSNFIHNFTGASNILSVNPLQKALSFLPLCHVAERNLTTFCGMTYGWVVNFAENLETVPENIKEISPDTFFAVPRFWEKFYSSIILRMQESTRLERKIFDWAVTIGEAVRVYRFNKKAVPLHLRMLYTLYLWLSQCLTISQRRLRLQAHTPCRTEILTSKMHLTSLDP